VSVTFRGRLACECQAEWIPAFEHELQRRGVLVGQIPIAQLIGTFSGSGSTHGFVDSNGKVQGGGASDFWLLGVQGEVAVMVARQMGADATWHRLAGWDNGGGSEHVHSVLRGCPHLTDAARAQIAAVDLGGDGLVGSIPDPGPRPLSGRTWREGIEWQRQQEEDDVRPEDIDAIADKVVQKLLADDSLVSLKPKTTVKAALRLAAEAARITKKGAQS
jgi:hypothetical protein